MRYRSGLDGGGTLNAGPLKPKSGDLTVLRNHERSCPWPDRSLLRDVPAMMVLTRSEDERPADGGCAVAITA